MHIRLALALLLLLSTAASAADNQRWRPGSFRGLTVGRSTFTEAQRVLGPPEGEPKPSSEPAAVVYTWADKSELGGDIEVTVRKRDNIVTQIAERLSVALPRTPAYKRFGTDYRFAHYSRADCAAPKGGVAPVYRDKNGQIETIEYPSKGIVLSLDQLGYDIASVLYVNKAPGLRTPPPCVKGKKRVPATKPFFRTERTQELGTLAAQHLKSSPVTSSLPCSSGG